MNDFLSYIGSVCTRFSEAHLYPRFFRVPPPQPAREGVIVSLEKVTAQSTICACNASVTLLVLLYLSALNSALKHTYQLRGMANTLRIRTTISPGQW